ncbi:MAG: HAD-IIA family hydrolase [Desulfomonilaceae bacterium]
MNYKAVLADLDGTINRGNTLIAGADAIYRELSEAGVKWVFLSNNATSLASDLALKLSGLGLNVSEEQVINSATALIQEVSLNFRQSSIMVIGHSELIEGLKNAGARITDDPSDTDIVVVALDRYFTYEKMKKAHRAIHKGALFWATNLDVTFPEADGFSPGAGSVAASISSAVGKGPDRVFGKPSTDMATLAMERLGVKRTACLVVGDRMETDIEFARRAGMASVLVLTGATSRSDLAKYSYAPNYILDSIADLGKLF